MVLKKESKQKSFALLIDPDNVSTDNLVELVHLAVNCNVDYIFWGGSLVTNHESEKLVSVIKGIAPELPILLFPGHVSHVVPNADALLFLSLISGRNPEFLIGQHVIAAPLLKKTNLEIISTGYILINSGVDTTVSYISNTTPIPHQKDSIAACTAMAGEMLGLKLIYMDGGSGAINPISPKMVNAVSQSINSPLIIGGGIRDVNTAREILLAGADIIVIGNAIEKDKSLIKDITNCIKELNAN